jgi:prolyl-tRNA editing enzyme YbaK/EbsC (Cys-tRNA(Pro) deacylase)
MTEGKPDPIARVQSALDALELSIQVQTFDVPTSTAQEAADAIGCPLGAIVKSLCFLVDETLVLVLAAGDRRVDTKVLRQIYGVSKRKCRIADPETVLRITGFAIGGVAPVGHLEPLTTLIDDSLSRFETVYAAAGTGNSIFGIPYATLVEVTAGQVHELAKETPA